MLPYFFSVLRNTDLVEVLSCSSDFTGKLWLKVYILFQFTGGGGNLHGEMFVWEQTQLS